MQTHSSVLKLNQQFFIGPPLQKHYFNKHSTLPQDPLRHLTTLTYGMQVSLPHTFVQPSHYYYSLQDIKMHTGVAPNGITLTPTSNQSADSKDKIRMDTPFQVHLQNKVIL
jgi:hypothetical protein